MLCCPALGCVSQLSGLSSLFERFGLAGALEFAVRVCSTSPGRSNWPIESVRWRSNWSLVPARLRWGAQSWALGLAGALAIGRSNPLDFAECSKCGRSASLTRSNWTLELVLALRGHSKWPLESIRSRWGARIGRSSLLGGCSSPLGFA